MAVDADDGENYITNGLLDKYTQRERDNLAGNKRIHIAQNEEQIYCFINDAAARKNSGEKLLAGKIGEHLSNRIEEDTGINLHGYNLELRSDEIRHLIKEHGTEMTELPRGQRAITTGDIYRFIDIVTNYNAVELARDNSLHFKKDTGGTITAVCLYAGKSKSLSLKTMYAGEKGGRPTTPHTTPTGERAMNTPNDAGSQALSYTNKIRDSDEKVNS